MGNGEPLRILKSVVTWSDLFVSQGNPWQLCGKWMEAGGDIAVGIKASKPETTCT